MDPKA